MGNMSNLSNLNGGIINGNMVVNNGINAGGLSNVINNSMNLGTISAVPAHTIIGRQIGDYFGAQLVAQAQANAQNNENNNSSNNNENNSVQQHQPTSISTSSPQ